MRGLDNWKNAYDYILNQLFKYDYTNEEHLHILKMKFWVLDDDILIEENLVDNNYENPLNHRKILQNELVFLDRYIRTKDKKLNEDEPFSTLVKNRQIEQKDFISEKNPQTNKKYEKWEQDYLSRPTTITNSQFQELYVAYKKKETNNELSSAYEITSKLDTITIDNKKFQQENAINLLKTPDEQKEIIKLAAIAEKKKEDIHFVEEMNRAHNEIISLVLSIKPELPEPPKNDENTGSTIPNPNLEPTKKIEWLENNIYICNFPTLRVNVGETKNDPSHKGLIIESQGQGGYRFNTKSGNDLITNVSLPPIDLNEYINEVSPFMDSEVEWTFDNWEYAHWYVEKTTTTTTTSTTDTTGNTTSNSESTSETKKYLKPFNINKNSFNTNNLSRFNELNKRWMNFNELRERQMANIGSRYQLEAMFNAEVNDIKENMKKILTDRKEEKENIINILKDICLYSEFK